MEIIGTSDGELTLFENIADLGPCHVALRFCPGMRTDYQAFLNLMPLSGGKLNPQMADYFSKDVHSNAKLRVNRTVVNFDEF